jgi:hypothetical protein
MMEVKGNIWSLIDSSGENWLDGSLACVKYMFTGLFRGNLSIVDASDLVLPATTLNTACYSNLFAYCSSLILPPKLLPALSLFEQCYGQMFINDVALEAAPVIAATSLAKGCCNKMFNRMHFTYRRPRLASCYTSDAVLPVHVRPDAAA